MDSISQVIGATFKQSRKSAVRQVDVDEITEDPCDMDVIKVTASLDSDASHELHNVDSICVTGGCHVLDRDPGMGNDRKGRDGYSR